jgi:deoxyribonuclease IV
MPILGAHLSIAGGYFKAADSAARLEMDTVQIFTKNNNQWQGKPLSPADIASFHESVQKHHLRLPISHSSYLINLASPDDVLRRKSIDAMVVELQRAAALGLEHVVLHPGSHTTASETEGLAHVAESLEEILAETRSLPTGILLENTAGQGSNLGWKFEHLGHLLSELRHPPRVGVCFDTCHAFAAGYRFSSAAEYRRMWEQFDDIVGMTHLQALHLNDSKRECGSRVDRHEHVGRGHLGLEAFWRIMRDPRLADLPMFLETPKGTEDGMEHDTRNLMILRRLASSRSFSSISEQLISEGLVKAPAPLPEE